MGLNSTVILGVATAFGAALGAAAFASTGASSVVAGFGGLLAAGCGAALGYIYLMRADHAEIKEAFLILQADFTGLLERQAQAEAKMGEMERRTIESPALVWRAATADIQVLSALVSDLAKTVSDHDQRLTNVAVPKPESVAEMQGSVAVVPPEPAPQSQAPHWQAPGWYEDEAELGFTADAVEPVEAIMTTVPSPAVLAELKTTLASALASDRLELCLQPIVALPQRKTRGYEASLRLKGEGGEAQSNVDLRRIAEATGLEAELDRVLLERAAQVLRILRARNREVAMSFAVSGRTLASPAFGAAAERLFRSDQSIVRAITLEISDADFRALPPAGRETMAGLGAKGMSFGLAGATTLNFDMTGIAAAAIRQVKVTAHLLLNGSKEAGVKSDIHPADLAEFLNRREITLLVSDITSEQTVIDLLDYAAPLAMGPLFGTARAVRPEVLEPKPVDASGRVMTRSGAERVAAQKAAQEGAGLAGKAQRQSFRSLLRRA